MHKALELAAAVFHVAEKVETGTTRTQQDRVALVGQPAAGRHAIGH